MSLAERAASEIRAEMARQRRTTREFATAMGVSTVTASRILNGRRLLDLDELSTIAAWLSLDVNTLLARVETVDA